jgi:Protein of unknown function (DUF3592)
VDTTFILAFVVPIVLGTVILAIGGALLFWNSRRTKRGGKVETQDWQTTGGKVLAAHLEEHSAPSGDKPDAPVIKTYEPVVEYVYTVSGVEYHGSKVFPGGDSDFGQEEAQDITDRYPLNSYALVRYDPQNPSASSLEEHSPHSTHYLLVAAQSLIALGIGVCCFTFFMMFILVGRFQ